MQLPWVQDPEPAHFDFACGQCDFRHRFYDKRQADDFIHEHLRQHADDHSPMTTLVYSRERLATELAATQARINSAITGAPWYGRWLMRALWWACRVWVRVRR